ncbi:hypothetical protein [Niabella hibiscisoli]|uniref:hypothetical protein n=1 Tax=Niabella hibiscisoli TaxID=1825928 RepID=UPI001F1142C1|nr:hypothetical protein [Niabella hibiscisoli]MCH5719550.1 hypothetical protein [Niabella hibiscisoli]
MLARVALFAGGFSLQPNGQMQRPNNYKEYYTLAQQQINDIMAANPYKLNTSYPQVFINQSKHVLEPTESIFEIAFYTPTGPAGEAPNASRYGYFNAPATATGVYGGTSARCLAVRPFMKVFRTGTSEKILL